jgi:sugar O-acyltransferase (sialic acid O-acetyltransferase NeuD family)
MNKLIIIGAGNVGGYLSYNIDEFGSYEVLGFLDDDKSKHGKTVYGTKVLGATDSIGEYLHQKTLCVVVGISFPAAKSEMVANLSKYNLNYPNFVAKNVWLSKNVQLGRGVILYPGVSINYETVIKDFVIMNMNCAIGHNCTINDYSTLAPGVNLAGFTHIEDQVSIGIGVSTKQNIRIGKGSLIGGQSMLIGDVTAGSKIIGVPGKKIKV